MQSLHADAKQAFAGKAGPQSAAADGVVAPSVDGPGLNLGDDGAPASPPVDLDAFPLTDLQRAYLVGREASIPLGGVSCCCCLELERTGLAPETFERVWNSLIRRNSALRLVIEPPDRQRILAEVPWLALPLDELPEDSDAADAVIAAAREAVARQVRDPARWPLHDVRLLRHADGRLRVLFHFDLIAIDAGSVASLAALFEEELASSPHDRPSPSRAHFAEHCRAAHDAVGRAAWERHRAWWQEALAELPAAPQLPYAAAFEAVTPPRFERRVRRLDAPAAERLRAAAKAHGLTLEAVVNAAFAETLAAWSADRRFLLNLPIFDGPRRVPGRWPPLGNFTSNLLVDADMRTGSFAERAHRLGRGLLRALRHRHYSGVRVLKDLGQMRRQPFQPHAPVVLTNLLGAPREEGAWRPHDQHGLTRTPQVVLDHQVRASGDALTFYWDSASGALRPEMLDAMADAHLALVERLGSDAAAWSRPALTLASAAERRATAAANATAHPLPNALLHEGFFAQARARPDAVALVEQDRPVTYGTLAAMAGRVLAALARAGVGSGDAVACALPAGSRLCAAALGTLAAGGVYAPLDPGASATRRSREIAILRPAFAIADPAALPALRQAGIETRLWEWLDDGQPPPDGGARHATPDAPAYVIFTSGTTGDPKAIVIAHRAAANTCLDIIERFKLDYRDRVLALSAPTFDLSIFDMFGIWAAGGAMVLPDRARTLDPAVWMDAITAHQVSIWNSVPAQMSMLAAHLRGRRDRFGSLRTVMLSGDWIPPALLPEIARLAPQARLVGLGGATEASIWSIMQPMSPADAGLPAIPYGRPLRNQTIHVMDEMLAERPSLVEGDIHIGGAGLADGYLGDPGRTAAAFVVHPETGERLYRTGDRGRRRTDGVVEFLGRRDTQFKRQGFRIEAGEIESALRRSGGVTEAVVEAVGDRFGGKQLVAFVIPAARDPAPQCAAPTAGRRWDTSLPRISLDARAGPLPRARSARGFGTGPASFDEVARLLAPLRRRDGEDGPAMAYPSASGLYPVHTYLLVAPDRVAGLASGLYVVEPAGALVRLSAGPRPTSAMHVPHNRALAEQAAFALLLFGHLPSIAPTYGGLARDLCLVEAGYIGQALMAAAAKSGLDLCPIGAMAHGEVAAAAGLGDGDVFLHAFLGGARAEAEAAAAPAGRSDLAQRLRERLREELPTYMLPNDIVLLEHLPLTANGKIDRAALKELAPARPSPSPALSAPKDDVEHRLVALAERVLDIGCIDPDREFFALGADSVKLVELAAAIEQEFGRRFQVMDAFAHPTLRRVAAHLAADAPAGASDPTVARAQERAERRRRPGPGRPGTTTDA